MARPIPPRICPLHRKGQASPAFLGFLASAVTVVLLIALLLLPVDWPGSRGRSGDALLLYCAAGMRLPVERILAKYRSEYGVNVQVEYAGSNVLLGKLELSGKGDLFLSADKSYLELGRERELVDEVLPLARMNVVVGVPRGNPRNIQSLDDLLQTGVRIVLANPDQAAIGSATRRALQTAACWALIETQTRQFGVFKPTVGEIANDLQLGSVDAGFLWDAVAEQYPEIDIVRLPQLSGATGDIGIGLLRSSKHSTAAIHFARYVAARDRGLLFFEADGFEPVDGDLWVDAIAKSPEPFGGNPKK